MEQLPPHPIEAKTTTLTIRLHHLISIYYILCLSPEEQARTLMFNDQRVYGEKSARSTYNFYKNVLDLPEAAEIKIVASLDEVCAVCPIIEEACNLPDAQVDYEIPRLLGIDVGAVITLGELKARMKTLYPQHHANWKEEKWKLRLEQHPDLAEYSLANFWLYQ